MPRSPTCLVFDSGLGGLTVYEELRQARPDAAYVYAADDVGFPYGERPETELQAHVVRVIDGLVETHRPDVVVLACNTASTLVLPRLRARWPALPFVGTVPAIKPAAEASRSKIIAVLATPGTVARDYTRELIQTYAAACRVELVGSRDLATLAEAAMAEMRISAEAVRAEIAPCFVEEAGRRTDAVVLACTHYPLLLEQLSRAARWPVAWIDPAAAIARQFARVIAQAFPPALKSTAAERHGAFVLTSGASPSRTLLRALRARGLTEEQPAPVRTEPA